MSDESQNNQGEDISAIVECLERQTQVLRDDHEALLLLVRRTDSFGSELRGVSETLETIAHRQAELEASSERRRATCVEMMHSLADRIAALEHDSTPIPRRLTCDELCEMSPRVVARRATGSGNGCNEDRVALATVIDDDDDEES
jgi:hypothetical protein